MSRCWWGTCAEKPVSVRDVTQHLAFGRMLPAIWGWGILQDRHDLFLPAPAQPLDMVCPSRLPPARRPLSFPLSALLLPDSPARTTLQIPPVVRPKPSASFSAGAEHPHASLSSPGCCHPDTPWRYGGCCCPPGMAGPGTATAALCQVPWGGRGRGCRPLCPVPSPVCRLCPSSSPQARMEGTPVCMGTASGTAVPAHGDGGLRGGGRRVPSRLAPLPHRLPALAFCGLRLLPGTLSILMENCFLLFAIQGNWHLLMCLGSLFLSAVCTLTHLHSASLSQRGSDLLLFYYYLDARCKGND